jgi:hypothetical protein
MLQQDYFSLHGFESSINSCVFHGKRPFYLYEIAHGLSERISLIAG